MLRRANRTSMVLVAGAFACAVGSSVAAAGADEFAVNVGPPVAGRGQTKTTVFVVRPGGCADPAKARFTSTAEGIVNGARQSLPVKLTPLAVPGVHAVPQAWPKEGVWVVSIAATCDGKSAGAIVKVDATPTFAREGVTLLKHAPTIPEIDQQLKAGGR